MYELETRIEEIHLTAKRLAEGLLLDAVEQRFRDRDIAEAARFYHQSILRHEDAQRWREKVKVPPGAFDFDNMDWGKDDDDDPFYSVEAGASPPKIKNKKG